MIISLLFAERALAQTDSATVVIHKDPRIDDIIRQQIQINEGETTPDARRNIPGFWIQVINSTDRKQASFRARQKFTSSSRT